MKTEKEIREEIEAHKNCIKNWRKANERGDVTKDQLKSIIKDCRSIITALRWVLGEHERFD